MNDTYFELSIAYNRQYYETIYNRLYKEKAGTILEEAGVIKVYFPNEKKDRIEDLTIKLIVLDGIPEKNITVEEYTEHNCNSEWEKTIEPAIIKSLKHIHTKLKSSGKFFATGILKEEKTKVQQSLKRFFKIIETRNKANWVCFYCVKN